jgi:transposase-like protein
MTIEPRIYCKSCNEFKQLRYGGSYIKTGWICKLCFNKLIKSKLKGRD